MFEFFADSKEAISLCGRENDSIAGQARAEEFKLRFEEANLSVSTSRPSLLEQHEKFEQPVGPHGSLIRAGVVSRLLTSARHFGPILVDRKESRIWANAPLT